MFITSRILSGVATLIWLGLLLAFFDGVKSAAARRGSSFGEYVLDYFGYLLVPGIPFMIHLLLAIYVQNRKKWAVAGMFVMASINLGLTLFFMVMCFFPYTNMPVKLTLLICIPIALMFMMLIWSLSESYKAITQEKEAAPIGFEPVMKAQPVSEETPNLPRP